MLIASKHENLKYLTYPQDLWQKSLSNHICLLKLIFIYKIKLLITSLLVQCCLNMKVSNIHYNQVNILTVNSLLVLDSCSLQHNC